MLKLVINITIKTIIWMIFLILYNVCYLIDILYWILRYSFDQKCKFGYITINVRLRSAAERIRY